MGVYTNEIEEWLEEQEKKESILSIADRLVSEDRAKQYGSFAVNAKKAIDLYYCIKRTLFIENAQDVALFMICLKLGREVCKHKRDNLIDIAGYLKLWDELINEKETT